MTIIIYKQKTNRYQKITWVLQSLKGCNLIDMEFLQT